MINPAEAQPNEGPWLVGTGSIKHPVTHGGATRVGRYCRCLRCGMTALCSPERDFYTTDDPAGPLYCECCMWAVAAEVIKLADAGLVPGRSLPINN